MSVVRIEVTLLHDDEPVHAFTRSTTNDTAVGVRKMLAEVLSWAQLYESAIGEQQWRNDVDRIHGHPRRQARALGDELR